MMLGKRLLNIFLCTIVVLEIVSCASVSDIRQMRDLPGSTPILWSKEYYYDPTILSYRFKEPKKEDESAEHGKVIRDAAGEKIQTDEELQRFIQVDRKEHELLKTPFVSTIVLAALYIPITLPFDIIEGILTAPLSGMFLYYRGKLQDEAEKAYVLGRQYFVDHRMEDALSEFDYAKNLIPSLQAFSDIDYWRGRVFEDIGKEGDTKISYMYFINYSERSMPEFFKVTYPDDPTWLEKAQDAQIRLKKIQVTNSFEKESLRQ